MYISSVKIGNYKSFDESPVIRLAPGFNIVAGQNSAGKTALLEALAFDFHPKPHRSLKTARTKDVVLPDVSWVDVRFVARSEEVKDVLASVPRDHVIAKPVPSSDFAKKAGYTVESEEANLRWLSAVLSEETLTFGVRFVSKAGGQGWELHEVPACGLYPPQRGQSGYVSQKFQIDEQRRLRLTGTAQTGASDFALELAQVLRGRVYRFAAERMNVSRWQHGNKEVLAQNAQNLPEVLNLLQHNTSRFQRLNRHVTEIFPVVKQVSVRAVDQMNVEIVVWSHDPTSERADVAVPLSEAGTGIGQVLAIAYVVLTSDRPQTIIIDEPQSFLHPSASRKLIEFLKSYAQHQYVIATHSPTIISATNPGTITLVRFGETESAVEQLDAAREKGVQATLTELGVRLSDVFGADSILWVEGRTEEKAYPIIVEKLLKRSLGGIQIMGVRQTGDLEGRDAKKVFEIYRRLANGASLLPPALTFILDDECRSAEEKLGLQRLSQGSATFLLRRMYENYLLNPGAIAAVANGIEGFRDGGVTSEQVRGVLERLLVDGRNYCSREQAIGRDRIKYVDGGRLLDQIFSELSEMRVRYDKVRHGVELTEWLIANAPVDLKEVADLLRDVLDSGRGVQTAD